MTWINLPGGSRFTGLWRFAVLSGITAAQLVGGAHGP